MIIFFPVIGYLIAGIGVWGALLAELQSGPCLELADSQYREDLAPSLLGWIFVPFILGFFEHGWQLSRRKS